MGANTQPGRGPSWESVTDATDRGRRSCLVLVLLVVALAVAAWRRSTSARAGSARRGTRSRPPNRRRCPPPEGIEVPDLPEPAPVAEPADGGALQLGPPYAGPWQPRTADPDLGRSVHVAVSALSGPGAAYVEGSDAFIPASTLKLLTATAALAELGPDHRFATTVVAPGPHPDARGRR